jgi:small-conductance mechanosensitive channel
MMEYPVIHSAGRCARRVGGLIGTIVAVALPSAASAAEAGAAGTSPGGRARELVDIFGSFAGSWYGQEAIVGFTWGQLLVSGGLLVLLGSSVQVLRWYLRRQAKRNSPSGAEARESATRMLWIKLSAEALVPPLTLFLWVWGLYAAFAVLFPNGWSGGLVSDLLAWAHRAGLVIALFWLLFRMIKVVESQLQRWTGGTESKWDDVLAVVTIRAVRLIVPLLGIIFVVPTLDLSVASNQFFRQGAGLCLIGTIGFVLYQIVQSVETAVLGRFRIDVRDNLEARKVYTQVKVLKKIATVVIILFTLASMLMVFDSVRQLGTSILASAGVLGIIVGFAAQRSIATVLAGFQIAMTQPIRLDDVVIVEGEWGRIEEITLTYVVVLIWDQRRLVVPINHFIEKPFQNWTRVSADLLGTIFVYTDYTVPLQALRDELDRILAGTQLWDGRVKGIQVTDSKERTLELRVLVSAADAPSAWDLRCLVREKLIAYLQREHPQALPRLRAELDHVAEKQPEP